MRILKIVSAFMNHQHFFFFVRYVGYTKWYSKQQKTFTKPRICGFDFLKKWILLSFTETFSYTTILL